MRRRCGLVSLLMSRKRSSRRPMAGMRRHSPMKSRLRQATHTRESELGRLSLRDRPTNLGNEPILARLAAVGPNGDPWITCPGKNQKPRRAFTTVPLGPASVGREVLAICAGSARVPVVVGLLIAPGDVPIPADAPSVELLLNRERIVLTARQEVVLTCGRASITLSADGKVVVRGADIVSSAGRVNRIRGGAVKIN